MEKKQIKAMCFILSLLMCQPQFLYAKEPKRIPGTAIFVMATVPDSVSIEDKHITVHKDGIQIDMHIPQFVNLTNLDFQKQLNHNLLKEAKERKSEILKLAQSLNKDFSKDDITSVPFEYIETYSVIPSPYPYFTLELYRYQYTGGAHGLPELNYLNLNIEENEICTLDNLFKDDIDYKPILNQAIKEEIIKRTNQGEFFFTGTDGFQTISDNQPFFINKEGNLVIVFNVYEIAPYASGPIYIIISKENLKEYMK